MNKVPIVVTPQLAKDHLKGIQEHLMQIKQDMAVHKANKEMAALNPKPSLTGHLTALGHPTDLLSRHKLAAEHGIHHYAGTEMQDEQLFNALRNVPPPTPQDKMRKQLMSSLK